MKKKHMLTLALAAGVLALAGCNNNGGETLVKSDAGNITTEDFYDTMKKVYGSDTETVLKDMVYRKVLEDQFDVSKDDVDKRLQEFIDENFASDDEYKSYLKQYNLKEEDLRDDIKYMLLQEVAFTRNIDVTDDEVKQEYLYKSKDVTARHILIPFDQEGTEPKDGKTAEDRANEIVEKLNAGEDFAELAKQYSQDPGSAEKGGDLGVLNPDQLDPDFAKAAFQLDQDEISKPVKSSYGYHIIQVTKIEDKKGVKPLDEIKDEVERDAKVRKMDQETIQKELDKILDEANVKVEDDDFKDIFKAADTKTDANAQG